MGKKNFAVNQFLARKEIFADLINGTVFQGRQILRAEQMEQLSEQTGIMQETSGNRLAALERRSDIRMRASIGTYAVVIANETQGKVHYAMPVRNMLYDALEYTRQIQELEKKHRRQGERLQGDEFLSGITAEDRLCPVLTTVLYLGEEWDGRKSLHEMMDLDEADETLQTVKRYLPDYRINLIPAHDVKHTERFQTCLQQIFCMLKYNKDKKQLYDYITSQREVLRRMDDVEMMAAFVMLGEQKRVEKLLSERKSEEGIDMCQAIDELINDGKEAGRLEGAREGRIEGKIEGKIEGESRVLRLINALIADNRQNLIAQMAGNRPLREELYRQYRV